MLNVSITKTKRLSLLLVPEAASVDLAALCADAWLSDPKNTVYTSHRTAPSPGEAEDYINDLLNDWGGYWLILHDSTLIGSITGRPDASFDLISYDIGILLNHPFWGHGYGCEAWEAVMRYLQDEGAERFTAGYEGENVAMARLAAKCGMVEYARDGKHIFVEKVL